MLSKKLFLLINKVALFAIVFASLAPSISHALAAQSDASFAQEICTTDGKKITIQVVTSKGQQLATELSKQTSNDKAPTGIQHHLQHCPFCANSSIDSVIEASYAPIIALLTAQAEKQVALSPVFFTSFSTLPPPAQAPPSL